jgi:hypothetical protein
VLDRNQNLGQVRAIEIDQGDVAEYRPGEPLLGVGDQLQKEHLIIAPLTETGG